MMVKRLLIFLMFVGLFVGGCAEKKTDITILEPNLTAQIEKSEDSCDRDEDCVLDDWAEGVCCDSGCLNYAVNTAEHDRRTEWRTINCDKHELNIIYAGIRNGTLSWDDVPDKWAPCFIFEDQCGPEGFFKEAYCDKGVCKGKK